MILVKILLVSAVMACCNFGATKACSSNPSECGANEAPPNANPRQGRQNQFINKAAQEGLAPSDLLNAKKTKDCSGYKPNKRIQCDISLFNAGLITKNVAIDDITKACAEWRSEDGDTESMYYLGFDVKNFAPAIGHTELWLTTWQYVFPLTMPKWSYSNYIEHYKPTSKPTIVYSFTSLKGNGVTDHWVGLMAQEGRGSRNLLYVQDGSSSAVHGESCDAFNKLPRSVRDRVKVSVVLSDAKYCETIPQTYTVKVGRYELATKIEKRSYDKYIPIWECERTELDWECFGEINTEDYNILERHFLD